MKSLFDTHAHLLDPRLIANNKKFASAVGGVLCIYSPDQDLKKYSSLISREGVWGAAGIHPHQAQSFERNISRIKEALQIPETLAVGEMGLDFYYMNSPPKSQKKIFRSQLQLAREKNLPVVVHSRNAFSETMSMLDENPPVRTVIHCFSGTEVELKECLKRDFYIGIGGILTFPKSHHLREAVKIAPIEKILLETDCPYLAPVPMRGKTNQPAYLKYIAQHLAELKLMEPEEIGSITFSNAMKFLGLSK